MKIYKVIDYEDNISVDYSNKKWAKKHAKGRAGKYIHCVSVDLWDDEDGVSQFIETIASFDPMGKLLS